MNHQSYSPVVKHFAWLWWSPTASEALSYRLNLYRSMPPDLPRTLCIIRSRKKFGALRTPHDRTNPTLYLCPGPPPPSSTSGSAPEFPPLKALKKNTVCDWYHIHQTFYVIYLSCTSSIVIQQGHCLVLAHTVVDTEPLLGHNFGLTYILECSVDINSVVIE